MSSLRSIDWENINDFLLSSTMLPSLLKPQELCQLSCVSKKHHKICNESRYWEQTETEVRFKYLANYSFETKAFELLRKQDDLKNQYLRYKSLKYQTLDGFITGYKIGSKYLKENPDLHRKILESAVGLSLISSVISYFSFRHSFSLSDTNSIQIIDKNSFYSITCTALTGLGTFVATIELVPVSRGLLESFRITFPMLLRLTKKRMLEDKSLTITEISIGTTMAACTGVSASSALALSLTAVSIGKIVDKSILTKKGSRTLLSIVKKILLFAPTVFQCCRRR